MREWQEYIEEGNEHFRREAFELAEAAYIQACERALKIFHHSRAADQSVNTILTSYHNLANSLKCQERYQAALEVLKKLHQLIHQSLEEAPSGSLSHDILIKAHFDTYRELARLRNAVEIGETDCEAFYPKLSDNIPKRQRHLN